MNDVRDDVPISAASCDAPRPLAAARLLVPRVRGAQSTAAQGGMGVPNLYRWLSERYPLINRPVDESMPMPEVDNFYLDANGILHKSTHGDAGAF